MKQRGRRTPEAVITLYECPPLHARLSARQCAANRARLAAEASPRDSHRWHGELAAPSAPRECAKCPGVLHFAAQSGHAPRRLATAELVRLHVEGEERRRRTRLPLEEPAGSSLRLDDVRWSVGRTGPVERRARLRSGRGRGAGL